jgi:hypothetical protein
LAPGTYKNIISNKSRTTSLHTLSNSHFSLNLPINHYYYRPYRWTYSPPLNKDGRLNRKERGKLKVSLGLIKYDTMKTYGRVKV